jgi:hypothetical protein
VPAGTVRTVLHTVLAARPVPTTADWLTAWTTLGAFLAAGAAAVVAYRGLNATQQGLKDERETRKQEIETARLALD